MTDMVCHIDLMNYGIGNQNIPYCETHKRWMSICDYVRNEIDALKLENRWPPEELGG